jgi:Flp pilus assembly pilin Flp
VARRLATRQLVRRGGGDGFSSTDSARFEDGATAVEYALMVGLVAVGIITAVTTLKGKTESALFGAGQAIGGRFSTVVFDPNSSGSYPNDPAAATLGNAYGGSWTSSSYANPTFYYDAGLGFAVESRCASATFSAITVTGQSTGRSQTYVNGSIVDNGSVNDSAVTRAWRPWSVTIAGPLSVAQMGQLIRLPYNDGATSLWGENGLKGVAIVATSSVANC